MKQEKRKMNVKKKILLILAIIAILSYVIYIVYNLIIKPTDTFVIENGKISSEETVQGYIIRDETVLKGENYKNGLVQIKAEGEKVAKGEAIFRYYTNGEEKIRKQIEELDVKIQEAWEKEDNSIFTGDVKIIEQQIESKLTDIYHLNDLQKIKEYKKDLNSYLVRKAKIAGEKSPSGSYLKELIRQRSEYENQLNSGTEYLTSTRSGVVSYRVDGLEDILTPANFGSLSKNMLENLHLKTGQIISTSEESGKIIDNFCCYIACVLKDENLQEKGTNVGDSINIRLSNRKEVKATIEYISKENNEEDLVVFKLENYTEELINYRKISFDVIWWDVSGWKVPNNAIKHEKEDLAYVVCKRAGYTDKVYVQILKQGDKYSIIKNYDSGAELLEKGVSNDVVKNRKKVALYDEIQL